MAYTPIKMSMKPTGWFHIAWSDEIARGGVKPMKYFSQELVAFRTEEGVLTVLDAHCIHMGAHLGFGGKVQGETIACKYHGWRFGTEGQNTLIPNQCETVRKKARKWSVVEQHGAVFMWHDPAGGPPRAGWEVPDIFAGFEGKEVDPALFFPVYPHAIVDRPNEPIHPQLIQENAADTAHFQYTHGAPLPPECLGYTIEGPYRKGRMGFRSPKSGEIALVLTQINFGIGLAFAEFEGPAPLRYRLILASTPIDEDTSHCRVTYYFPRDGRAEMGEALRAFARSTAELYEEDARIWRHQKFVHRPMYAKQDVRAYSDLRQWCAQFYEAPAYLSAAMSRMADTPS